jgi:hypothetical protein
MFEKLVGKIKVKDPYVLNESIDSEVIFSIHIPYEHHSEIIDSS